MVANESPACAVYTWQGFWLPGAGQDHFLQGGRPCCGRGGLWRWRLNPPGCPVQRHYGPGRQLDVSARLQTSAIGAQGGVGIDDVVDKAACQGGLLSAARQTTAWQWYLTFCLQRHAVPDFCAHMLKAEAMPFSVSPVCTRYAWQLWSLAGGQGPGRVGGQQ